MTLALPHDVMEKAAIPRHFNKTKDTNEKKQRRHDANANDTKPHPAASYVPGKCHRTPEPADEGQETKHKPKTQTNNPDYGCLLD